MSRIHDFKPEDGNVWKRWDKSAPLFESFFIIGPPDFSGINPPTCIYEYPSLNKAADYRLEQFLFLDGPQFEMKAKITEASIVDLYSVTIRQTDHILFIKSESGNPLYFYCLRFRFTPFSRPSIISNKLLDEFIFYRDQRKCPSCLFALCLVTSHPFHDLYFRLLKIIVQIEATARITSLNLFELSKFWQTSDATINVWPQTSFEAREAFLDLIYNSGLPSFHEDIVFQLNRSFTFMWRWKMPSHDEIGLKMAVWGSKPLFWWVSLKDFLKLLNCVLLEYYIIVIGKNVESIVKTVSFFPQIVFPFMWMYPVITILPENLLEILDSPIPIIAGVYKSIKTIKIMKEICSKSDVVIIDLDKYQINFPPHPVPEMACLNDYTKRLKPVWDKRTKSSGFIKSQLLNIIKIVNEINGNFVNKIEASLVTKKENNVAVGSMFLSECYFKLFKKNEFDFLKAQISTQMFNSFKEQICRQRTENESVDHATSFQSLMTIGTWNVNVQLATTSRFEMRETAIGCQE